MIHLDLNKLNNELRHRSHDEIIDWALALSDERIVTTSFGVYSSVLLSTFARKDKQIKVVWCDTLFNNDDTYAHANKLINRFQLNIKRYTPQLTKEAILDKIGIPDLNNPKHTEFSEMVKLEPFKRAIKDQAPKIWFTNIRVRQNEYRDSKDILSYSADGILKVSPFYYWSDLDLDIFLRENELPKNESYFDPTKVLQNRECGIHFQ